LVSITCDDVIIASEEWLLADAEQSHSGKNQILSRTIRHWVM